MLQIQAETTLFLSISFFLYVKKILSLDYLGLYIVWFFFFLLIDAYGKQMSFIFSVDFGSLG